VVEMSSVQQRQPRQYQCSNTFDKNHVGEEEEEESGGATATATPALGESLSSSTSSSPSSSSVGGFSVYSGPAFLPPIPEYEYFSGHGQLPSSGHVSLAASSDNGILSLFGNGEDDDVDGGGGCTPDSHLAHASHHDLAFEWSMLCQDCTECWTGTGRRSRRELRFRDFVRKGIFAIPDIVSVAFETAVH
jgi:hypothetical protein